MIRNGFITDLLCKLPLPARIDLKNLKEKDLDLFPIMRIVENKMEHPIHKKMGQPLKGIHMRHAMLSLILYTGCDSSYDLCASQRAGDYMKWKFFDASLWGAIDVLSEFEEFEYPLFSGLANVVFPKNTERGLFATFLSASRSKHDPNSFLCILGVLHVLPRNNLCVFYPEKKSVHFWIFV